MVDLYTIYSICASVNEIAGLNYLRHSVNSKVSQAIFHVHRESKRIKHIFRCETARAWAQAHVLNSSDQYSIDL